MRWQPGMHVVCFNFMIRGGAAWGVGRALASEHMSWVAGTDQVEVSGLMLLARDALSFLAGSQHECHVSSYCHSPYAQGCVLERLWLKVDIFFLHAHCHSHAFKLFASLAVTLPPGPCVLPLYVALVCRPCVRSLMPSTYLFTLWPPHHIQPHTRLILPAI